jgi:hypothetical protein
VNAATFAPPARLSCVPVKEKGTRPYSGIRGHRGLAAFAVLCVLGGPGYAYGAGAASPAAISGTSGATVICHNKTYALCATAQCFYLDGVAYCKCDLMQGDSISATFEFDNGTQDVCDLLDQGVSNGYTVSTYSLPDQVTKEYAAAYPLNGGPPPLALYTCPQGSSTGPYAQCDGGVCFDSTTGKTFPGVGDIADNQILCSCPITDPKKFGPSLGYQISGPWQLANGQACGANGSQSDCCSAAYLNTFCSVNYSPTIPTGATIPVGAPTGVPVALARQLGDLRLINACFGR